MWDIKKTSVQFQTLRKAKFCVSALLQTVTLFPDGKLLPLFASYHKRDIDGWLKEAVVLFVAWGQGNSF